MLRMVIADSYAEFVTCCELFGWDHKLTPKGREVRFSNNVQNLVGYTPDQIIVYGEMKTPDAIKAWQHAPTRLRNPGARLLRITDRTDMVLS